MLILAVTFRKYYSCREKEKGIFPVLFLVPACIIVLLHVSYDFHGHDYSGPTLFKTQWIPYATMRNLSPLGYHIYDTFTFVGDNLPYIMTNKEKRSIKEWFAEKNENLPDNNYKAIFKGKNLIVIQVESKFK
jgi:phosphoglycerol transferase MdoB-like AlkP superfamily enzyme